MRPDILGRVGADLRMYSDRPLGRTYGTTRTLKDHIHE